MSRSLIAALVAVSILGAHAMSEQASGCVPAWFVYGHAPGGECGEGLFEAE
jgi:hypothetical protein